MPRFNIKLIKKVVIILSCVLLALLVLLFLVDAVYEPPKEVIVYPEGHLSDDIFTEQNNEYVPNESLPHTHTFDTIPYLVDTLTGSGARIGSGTVYKVSSTAFVYISEYSDPNSIQDIISSQFPSALLTDFVPEYTKVVTEVDKQGYINGFSAEYIAEDISVSNGAMKSDAVLMGYVLNTPQDDLLAGNHLWVSMGTTDIRNDTLETLDAYLTAIMNTVRLDDSRYEDLKEEAERIKEEAEKEKEAAEEIEDMGEPTHVPAPEPGSETSESAPREQAEGEELYKVDIPLDESYKTVKIDITWSEPNVSAVLELFNPEKTLFFEPVDKTETYASFVIENNDVGDYELRIKGSDKCGTIETPSVTAVTGEEPVTEETETENGGDMVESLDEETTAGETV